MSTFTPNLKLEKPDPSDKVDIMNLNGNFDILDGLVPPNMADYPIEIGKDGIWTYAKWKNGVAICYGTQTHTITRWSAWESLHQGSPAMEQVFYPKGLFVKVDYVNASVGGSIDMALSYGMRLVDRTPKVEFTRGYPTSVPYETEIGLITIGRWK